MKQSIQLRTGQYLSMTPQLQQAIRLLQLSSIELRDEIQEALDGNLMLEEGDEAERPVNGSQADERAPREVEPEGPLERPVEGEVQVDSPAMPDELPVDSQWDDLYESSLPAGSPGGEDSADFDPFAQHSRPDSLRDHLRWQLNLARISPRDEVIGLAVIDAIDEDGYLRCDDAEIWGVLDDPTLTVEEVSTMIHRVQSFDPPGVGARDLQECLVLQLAQLASPSAAESLALRVCREGFEYLPRHDLGALARRLGATEAALADALGVIRQLNPRPGRLIADTPPEYVVPDVIVRRAEGAWRVELNPETTPRIRVNTDYARLIRRSDQSADGVTLKNHLQEARWFIKSLNSRNDTVLRVATKIVELQKDFLERGDEAMKPLILRDISEPLGLHESTISRVTSKKYLHTPRGTFEFKYFFSSHVNTTAGGECSSTAIRALIRKLVTGESARKPLSDNRIAEELASQGITVARRTVAKYREALGIPPSSERKRLA